MSGRGREADHPHVELPPMLERLVFFSDAVFAIAITLLVIELAVPHLAHGSHPASDLDYVQALADLLPSFFGYFLSFYVIGAFWVGHHRALGLAGSYDGKLVWPNLAMLCLIAFMPFATAFLSDNLGALVPAIFYNGVLVLLALVNLRVVHVATAPPIVSPLASPTAIAQSRTRSVGVLAGAALALVLTPFLPPTIAQLPIATIGIWQRLLYRRARRRIAAAAAAQD